MDSEITAPIGTDLIGQHGLESAWISLDLIVESGNEAIDETAGGTRNRKESSIEYFDLFF